jgi:hypothetical protein
MARSSRWVTLLPVWVLVFLAGLIIFSIGLGLVLVEVWN